MNLLSAKGLTGGYGGMDILTDVEIAVDANEIVVIIGPNGAGKSTVMKAIFGLLALREGSVVFNGTDITGSPLDSVFVVQAGGCGMCPEISSRSPSDTVTRSPSR